MNSTTDSLLVAAAIAAALAYCLWRLFAKKSKGPGCSGGCCPPALKLEPQGKQRNGKPST